MFNKKIKPPIEISVGISNFDSKYTKMKLQIDQDEEDEEDPTQEAGASKTSKRIEIKSKIKRAKSFSNIEIDLMQASKQMTHKNAATHAHHQVLSKTPLDQ
jgi:hypothetical protein